MDNKTEVPPSYAAPPVQQQDGYVATAPPMGMGQQPPTQPPMSLQGGGEVQPLYHQGSNVESQEWGAGLFNCSPCSSCLLGSFLPCIIVGKTSERLQDPSLQSYECCNADCMIFSGIHCLTGCGWIYAFLKRREIRERFGIRGSGLKDCCTTYWCMCCAVIQQDNEVKMRMARGPITQGYQSPQGMHAPGAPAPAPAQAPVTEQK